MSNLHEPTQRRRIAGEAAPSMRKAERRKSIGPAARVTPARTAAKKPAANPPTIAEPRLTFEKIRVRPRLQWRRLIPLIAVAVVAVIFGTVFAARGVSDYREQHRIGASNAVAAAAAAKAAETIFSFDYTALDEHLTASDVLMTRTFKKQFDKIAPALTDLAPQRKIQIKAKSQVAAAVECGSACSTSKASILVFLDQARLIGDSTTPTVFGNRIIVDMVNHDGTWLVNNIRAL